MKIYDIEDKQYHEEDIKRIATNGVEALGYKQKVVSTVVGEEGIRVGLKQGGQEYYLLLTPEEVDKYDY